LGAIILIVDILFALNIWFSLNIDAVWSLYTLLVGLVMFVIWFAISQFCFPLFLMQEEKKILLAIRNAYVIVFRCPVDALKVIALTLLITIVSIFIPPLWFFISMSLIAHLQTRAALKAVEKIQTQDADRDAADAHREGTSKEK